MHLPKIIKKHSSLLLSLLEIGGMAIAIGFAVEATPKALMIKENESSKKGRKLTKTETFKACAKCYIPTVIAASLTTGCIMCNHASNKKKYAALTAAYTMTETAFNEYRTKTIKEIGAGKEKKIVTEINKDRLTEKPASNACIITTGRGESLCYEPISSNYFYYDIEMVRKVINDLNAKMIREGYISVNDYLEAFNLPMMDGSDGRLPGDEIGWSVYTGIIDPQYDPIFSDDGRPCFTIYHRTPPTDKYRDLW